MIKYFPYATCKTRQLTKILSAIPIMYGKRVFQKTRIIGGIYWLSDGRIIGNVDSLNRVVK